MQVAGACHCGNVSFELDWRGSEQEIPARACTCSFCRKHGGVWTGQRDSALVVRLRDASLLSKYTQGTNTAEFWVCARCGVVPVVTSQIEGRTFAVVNVNALEGIDESLLKRASADFAAEAVDARLARRQRNWIGDVRVISAG